MTTQRPSFPARLDTASRVDTTPAAARAGFAIKKIASGAALTVAGSLKYTPFRLPAGTGTDLSAVRLRMVARLHAQGIENTVLLNALRAVERHCFVDSALVSQAYEDTSLPIGLGQTISKPSVVARMVELLLQADNARTNGLGRVLEIGTGCGYQAAVLAQVAKEVYSIERLRSLHEKARDNLRPFRLANVHLLLGDGMLGYDRGAPYAAIVAAAGGEALLQAWCDQLAVGGRLVAPMSAGGGRQVLMVVDKTPQGLVQRVLEEVLFVPLKSGIA